MTGEQDSLSNQLSEELTSSRERMRRIIWLQNVQYRVDFDKSEDKYGGGIFFRVSVYATWNDVQGAITLGIYDYTSYSEEEQFKKSFYYSFMKQEALS